MYRGQDGAGYTSNAIHPPLGRRWILELQKEKKPATSFNPPVVMGNHIYFGSNDKNFYALDVESGYMKWSFKTSGPVNSIPFADKNAVYFGSNDGNVYALDREYGKKLWSFNTGREVQSLVVRYEDMMIFTSNRGATYFTDLAGKPRFSVRNPNWQNTAFQVRDDIMYWMPAGNNLGAYNIRTRKFAWKERVPRVGAIWYSFPALDDKNIYFGSSYFVRGQGGRLVFKARRRKDGGDVWSTQDRMRPGTRVARNAVTMMRRNWELLDYLAPAIWRDTVIYTAGDTRVRAYDTDSGKKAWHQDFDYPISSAPVVAGDRVYFGLRGDENYLGAAGSGGRSPRLVCVSARDGRVLWQMDVKGVILSAPVISGNRIMFGTSEYLFYVLEEIF